MLTFILPEYRYSIAYGGIYVVHNFRAEFLERSFHVSHRWPIHFYPTGYIMFCRKARHWFCLDLLIIFNGCHLRDFTLLPQKSDRSDAAP